MALPLISRRVENPSVREKLESGNTRPAPFHEDSERAGCCWIATSRFIGRIKVMIIDFDGLMAPSSRRGGAVGVTTRRQFSPLKFTSATGPAGTIRGRIEAEFPSIGYCVGRALAGIVTAEEIKLSRHMAKNE